MCACLFVRVDVVALFDFSPGVTNPPTRVWWLFDLTLCSNCPSSNCSVSAGIGAAGLHSDAPERHPGSAEGVHPDSTPPEGACVVRGVRACACVV